MADGRHFENRYIAISQRKPSDFDEILYTAADLQLDEHHVIKNEAVALDKLLVRQNVFLVVEYFAIDVFLHCFLSCHGHFIHIQAMHLRKRQSCLKVLA